jgi:C_GCAxxG_C_C family probable redox protein
MPPASSPSKKAGIAEMSDYEAAVKGRADMIDKTATRSGELFASGYYWAESVLLGIAEGKGIQSDLIPKIATGFCGGVSRTCGMCGALSGGIMAIGLFTGRRSPEDSVLKSYEPVQELLKRFATEFGSTNCKDLTGCDLGTDEGQKQFKSNNLMEKCRGYTEEATRIAMGIIEGELAKTNP